MPKKQTREKFVEKSQALFGQKYSYDRVVYVSSQVPVTLTCPEHGDFAKAPAKHLQGQGCPKCARKPNDVDRRAEKFVLRAREVHGATYVYDKVQYINNSTPVTIGCREHGDFEQQPQHHLKGSNCPVCARVDRLKHSDSRKLTVEEFVKRSKKVHGDRYDYSLVEDPQYKNKVKILCPVHGEFQQRSVTHFRQGSGCPECGKSLLSSGDPRTETEESYRDRLAMEWGSQITLVPGSYKDSVSPAMFVCREHGPFEMNKPYRMFQTGDCPVCIKTRGHSTSKAEQELAVQLSEEFEVETNNRTVLDGGELDVYSSLRKAAVEYNGSYWHSEKFKRRKDHQNKTLACADQGVRLIHVWEYDYAVKKKVYDAMMSRMFGREQKKVDARKCQIRPVQAPECQMFLASNHLQGAAGASIRLGLYYQGTLVSVATFGRSRYVQADWELIRLCSKRGYNVRGGASRLLSAFAKEVPENQELVSYASLDYTYRYSNVYLTLGFEEVRICPPSYKWCKGDSVLSRYQTTKNRLRVRFPDADLRRSQSEILRERGYHRVYDAGNLLYKREVTTERKNDGKSD